MDEVFGLLIDQIKAVVTPSIFQTRTGRGASVAGRRGRYTDLVFTIVNL